MAKQSLTFAVGHDHTKMIKHYPFYAASWQIIKEQLNLLGYQVYVESYPWARAKTLVMHGRLDGLFLAANFKGREDWATLSHPIGRDQFGLFFHDPSNTGAPIGSVRSLSNYAQLSFLNPNKQIKLTTAQEGLKLLSNDKLSAFVMSRSYGTYLLNNELKIIRHKILFKEELSETYSAHIAVSKSHPSNEQIITLLNQAIKNAIKTNQYHQLMTQYNVPDYQWINIK